MKKYLKNCFILLIPVLLWNLLLTDHLPVSFNPEVFWKNIPGYIGVTENVLRMMVMILPVTMVLSLKTKRQKMGFRIYVFGTIVYFVSWLALIIDPTSSWSQSLAGFMAPAYTPLVWLIGIALIGNQSFFSTKGMTIIYATLSIAFVVFHCWHAYLVFESP